MARVMGLLSKQAADSLDSTASQMQITVGADAEHGADRTR